MTEMMMVTRRMTRYEGACYASESSRQTELGWLCKVLCRFMSIGGGGCSRAFGPRCSLIILCGLRFRRDDVDDVRRRRTVRMSQTTKMGTKMQEKMTWQNDDDDGDDYDVLNLALDGVLMVKTSFPFWED